MLQAHAKKLYSHTHTHTHMHTHTHTHTQESDHANNCRLRYSRHDELAVDSKSSLAHGFWHSRLALSSDCMHSIFTSHFRFLYMNDCSSSLYLYIHMHHFLSWLVWRYLTYVVWWCKITMDIVVSLTIVAGIIAGNHAIAHTCGTPPSFPFQFYDSWKAAERNSTQAYRTFSCTESVHVRMIGTTLVEQRGTRPRPCCVCLHASYKNFPHRIPNRPEQQKRKSQEHPAKHSRKEPAYLFRVHAYRAIHVYSDDWMWSGHAWPQQIHNLTEHHIHTYRWVLVFASPLLLLLICPWTVA